MWFWYTFKRARKKYVAEIQTWETLNEIWNKSDYAKKVQVFIAFKVMETKFKMFSFIWIPTLEK